MIQLSRLEGFYWVGRTGGYASAARAFPYPITQPAVHQQVRKLEGEIGQRLFERVARGKMRLTPAGRAPMPSLGCPPENRCRSGVPPRRPFPRLGSRTAPPIRRQGANTPSKVRRIRSRRLQRRLIYAIRVELASGFDTIGQYI